MKAVGLEPSRPGQLLQQGPAGSFARGGRAEAALLHPELWPPSILLWSMDLGVSTGERTLWAAGQAQLKVENLQPLPVTLQHQNVTWKDWSGLAIGPGSPGCSPCSSQPSPPEHSPAGHHALWSQLVRQGSLPLLLLLLWRACALQENSCSCGSLTFRLGAAEESGGGVTL